MPVRPLPAGRPRRARPRRAVEPPGPDAALEIATRFLGVRPRSEWEIEQRLTRAKATPEVIAGTLSRLRDLSLVDDLAFGRWWLDQRDRHAPRGRRLVEAELRQHRVPREVIEQLRQEIAAEASPSSDEEEGELPGTEGERAAVALQQHLRGRPLPTDPKALQRVGMFLVRRGFDPDTVRSTLRSAGDPSRTDA